MVFNVIQEILINVRATGAQAVRQTMETVSKSTQLLRKNTRDMAMVLGQSNEVWRRSLVPMQQNISFGARFGNTLRNLTLGTRGFRMEMLSVMFFGMALQRMFMGLLQPALQTAGVFEIFGATLEILFLPIALLVLGVLLPIADAFMNLPEPIRLAIGAFVLLGAIIGTILFVIGTLTLGIGGLILAFGPILPAIGGIVGAAASFMALFAVPILLAIGLVIGIIALLLVAFKENGEGIMRALDDLLSVIRNIFDDVMGVIGGFIDFFDAIVRLDAKDAVEALKKIFRSGVSLIINVFGRLPVAILRVIAQIGIGIGRWLQRLPAFIMSFASGIWDSFISVLTGWIEKLPEHFKNLSRFLMEGLQAMIDFLPEPFRTLFNVISGVGVGIGQGLRNLIGNIIPFQEGGIVTRPTVGLVGEAGPEAIVPLSRVGEVGFGAPTINITVNATPAAGVTADEIASVVERRLGDELRRLFG